MVAQHGKGKNRSDNGVIFIVREEAANIGTEDGQGGKPIIVVVVPLFLHEIGIANALCIDDQDVI